MKYLIIALACLTGIAIISLRETDLSDISEIPMEIVSNGITSEEKIEPEISKAFDEYWYAGQAELSGYDLRQSRYGEIHEGTATMIFVTEPFSRSKQVKLDDAASAGKDAVSVLKLNFTRNFLTGIYPYSMMTSTFNPVNTSKFQNALKLTLSGQEWCGQVFMQMNEKGSGYDVKSFSYFESEGDEVFKVNGNYLEDEIYNLIRLNPDLLPVGELEMVPSAVVSRFLHEDLKPYKIEAQKSSSEWKGKQVNVYSIHYQHNKRLLNIYYSPEFPYTIEGWDDTYSGFGNEMLTSEAVRKNTKMLDYWNKHDNEDRYLNKELYR